MQKVNLLVLAIVMVGLDVSADEDLLMGTNDGTSFMQQSDGKDDEEDDDDDTADNDSGDDDTGKPGDDSGDDDAADDDSGDDDTDECKSNDKDCDDVPDYMDNCPSVKNPNQDPKDECKAEKSKPEESKPAADSEGDDDSADDDSDDDVADDPADDDSSDDDVADDSGDDDTEAEAPVEKPKADEDSGVEEEKSTDKPKTSVDQMQLDVLCPKATHVDANSPAGRKVLKQAKACLNERKGHLNDACECVPEEKNKTKAQAEEEAKQEREKNRKEASQAKDTAERREQIKQLIKDVEAVAKLREEAQEHRDAAERELAAITSSRKAADDESEAATRAHEAVEKVGRKADGIVEKIQEGEKEVKDITQRLLKAESSLKKANKLAKQAEKKHGKSSQVYEKAKKAADEERKVVQQLRKSVDGTDDAVTKLLGRVKTLEKKIAALEKEYVELVKTTRETMDRETAGTALDQAIKGQSEREMNKELLTCSSDTDEDGNKEWDDACIAKIRTCRSHPNLSPDPLASPQSDGGMGLREQTSWDVYTQQEALGWNYYCLGKEITTYGHPGLKVDGVIKQIENVRVAHRKLIGDPNDPASQPGTLLEIERWMSKMDARMTAVEEVNAEQDDAIRATDGRVTQVAATADAALIRAEEAYDKTTFHLRVGFMYTRNRVLPPLVIETGEGTLTLHLRGPASQGVSVGGAFCLAMTRDSTICPGVMFPILSTSAHDLATAESIPMVNMGFEPTVEMAYQVFDRWFELGAYGGVLVLNQTNPNGNEFNMVAGEYGGQLSSSLGWVPFLNGDLIRLYVRGGVRFDNSMIKIQEGQAVVGTDRTLDGFEMVLERWKFSGLVGIESVFGL